MVDLVGRSVGEMETEFWQIRAARLARSVIIVFGILAGRVYGN